MPNENLLQLQKKAELLCARCERLQREGDALKEANRQLAAKNKAAKKLLQKILDRLPDYYR